MRPGITQFPVDVFLNLPVVCAAGSFIVCDPLGWVATRNRNAPKYAYTLVGQSSFYRINLDGAPSFQQMAAPPAALVFGAGVCAAWDATNQRVWVLGPGVGGGVDTWSGYFDTTAGTWTQVDTPGASLDALLGATWGTDGTMVSPDPLYGAITDQFLYVRGSNLNTFYQYDKLGDLWTALAVPGALSGAGVTLVWKYRGNGDRIISIHGGGSTAMGEYTIAGNAWGVIAPPTGGFADAPTAGTCACGNPDLTGGFWRLNATGQVYQDTAGTSLSPLGRIYGPDGTAAVGNKLCAYKEGGVTHILALLHGSSQIQRIRVVE